MKLKVRKISLLSLIFVSYVNFVHTQFAKGVVKNNVFTHYVNKSSGGSTDHLNINQDTTSIGYFRSKLSPTMVSGLYGVDKLELLIQLGVVLQHRLHRYRTIHYQP